MFNCVGGLEMPKDIVKELTEFIPDFKREIKEIPLEDTEPNRFNPRKKFGQEEEDELIESINSKGVLQPVIVYEKGSKYILLDGQRRYFACKKLGVKKIPAHVVMKEPSVIQNLSLMFHIHNVHEDWTDLAIAESLLKIIAELNIDKNHPTKENLKYVHKLTSLSYYKINKYLDVLRFPQSVIDRFKESELKEKPDLDLDLLAELRKPIKNIQKFLPSLSNKYSEERIVDIFVNKKKEKIITTNKQIRMLSKIITNAQRGKINKQVAIEKISEFFDNKSTPIEKIYSDTSEAIEQAKIIIRSSEKLIGDIENIDLRKVHIEDKQKLIDELRTLIDAIERKIKSE